MKGCWSPSGSSSGGWLRNTSQIWVVLGKLNIQGGPKLAHLQCLTQNEWLQTASDSKWAAEYELINPSDKHGWLINPSDKKPECQINLMLITRKVECYNKQMWNYSRWVRKPIHNPTPWKQSASRIVGKVSIW